MFVIVFILLAAAVVAIAAIVAAIGFVLWLILMGIQLLRGKKHPWRM